MNLLLFAILFAPDPVPLRAAKCYAGEIPAYVGEYGSLVRREDCGQAAARWLRGSVDIERRPTLQEREVYRRVKRLLEDGDRERIEAWFQGAEELVNR
jgi:hypothetical protein